MYRNVWHFCMNNHLGFLVLNGETWRSFTERSCHFLWFLKLEMVVLKYGNEVAILSLGEIMNRLKKWRIITFVCYNWGSHNLKTLHVLKKLKKNHDFSLQKIHLHFQKMLIFYLSKEVLVTKLGEEFKKMNQLRKWTLSHKFWRKRGIESCIPLL